MEFGNRLKELRLQRKMSLAEIAKKAGVPLSSYQEWEQGRRILDVKIYFKLAQALGVSFEFLIFGKEKQTRKDLALSKIDEIYEKLEELKKTLV